MVDSKLQIKLINQALAAAQASIELSKQLLADLSGAPLKPVPLVVKTAAIDSASIPGILGTYDGENMVTASGEKFPVPPNYASKTLLVYGDKLKMIDGESPLLPPRRDPAVAVAGGEKRKLFKSIERVKRQRVSGLLAKKDDQWLLVTSDGSHKVLEAAVNYFGFKEAQHLVGILPAENIKAPFAALEGPPRLAEGEAGPEKPPDDTATIPEPIIPVAAETLKSAKKSKVVKVKKITKASKKVK